MSREQFFPGRVTLKSELQRCGYGVWRQKEKALSSYQTPEKSLKSQECSEG